MAEKKKSGGWGLFLLFWTMLLLLLGFLACVFFYKYAAVYEQTRPEKAMDRILETMSEEELHKALADSVTDVSEYEDARTLFENFFAQSVRGKKLSYRRDMSRSDSDQTVFFLYAGAARLGEFRLVPDENSPNYGFGRTDWRLDAITAAPVTNNLAAITVQIDAPDGVDVRINGAPLHEEQIIDPAVDLTELTPLEARMGARIRMVRYEISPLYGDIIVTDGEGNEVAPLSAVENGLVRYVVKPTETYSFKIEAPEGVVVTVSGAELGEEEIASRESNMFRGLDSWLPDGGYETILYAADGLFTVPGIHASYEGVELSPVVGEDGKVYFFYPDSEDVTELMRSAAEGFFDAYMSYANYKYNGAALNDLLDRILPGTELDSYARNSYDAMIWASATEVSYDELRYENFHRVGSNCFTCTILYKADFTATSWYEQYSYAMRDGYKMVFIHDGSTWRAASMSAFD